jgi:hypothetical protein
VTTTSPSGSWISDYLGGPGDQSWFRFSLPSTRRVIMTAGSLPSDAKLELRTSCGVLVATSDVAGRHFEQLTRVLAAGTYRLHVVAKGGAASSSPYAVRFLVLPTGLPVLSYRAFRSGSTVRVAGELMNNTAATTGRVTVTATFLNGTRTVASLRGVAFANRVAVGAVTPFRLSGTVPTFTALRFTATASAPVHGPALSFTSLVYVPGSGGTTLEKGTIKNVGTTTARNPGVARIWYGTRGEVLDVGFATVYPTTLAPGRSGTFTVVRPASLTSFQATGSQWRAIF